MFRKMSSKNPICFSCGSVKVKKLLLLLVICSSIVCDVHATTFSIVEHNDSISEPILDGLNEEIVKEEYHNVYLEKFYDYSENDYVPIFVDAIGSGMIEFTRWIPLIVFMIMLWLISMIYKSLK